MREDVKVIWGMFFILLALFGLVGVASGQEASLPSDSPLEQPKGEVVEDSPAVLEIPQTESEENILEVGVSEEAESLVSEEVYIPLEEVVKEAVAKNSSFSEEKNDSRKVVENETEEVADLEDWKNESVNLANETGGDFVETLANRSDNSNSSQQTNPDSSTNEEEPKEKIEKTLVKDGRVELAFEIYEGEDIDITKKELMRGDYEKIVSISSEEHFEDVLRVYSDLPLEAKEDQVTIIWENEEEEVTSDIEYYDTNDNGLIDRISWIVPHLSTQLYSIYIEVDNVGNSSSMVIGVVSPTNSTVTPVKNPVNFSFNIDYWNVSALECFLQVDGLASISFDPAGDTLSSQSLNGGEQSWTLYCEDENNQSINAQTGGNILVQNDLSVNVIKNFYWKGDGMVFNVNANGGNTFLELVRPDSSEVFLGPVSGTFVSDSITHSQASIKGNYILKATNDYFDNNVTATDSFSVGDIVLDYDSSVEEDDEVDFDVTVYAPSSGNVWLEVDGDIVGSSSFDANLNGGSKRTVSYTPTTEGSYDVGLIVGVSGEPNKTKSYADLIVSSGEDKEDPDIDLEFPDWEETVTSSEINFLYSASDNVGVKTCNFSLYNTSKSSSGVYETEELLFPLSSNDKNIAKETGISNGEDVEVKLVDFDEGDYIWEVECYDDEGNRGWDFNYFAVDFDGTSSVSSQSANENYERKEDVESLVEAINTFLENEDSFGPEEREVVEVMGISSNMNAHKKKLLQIEQDLQYNLDFMEADKREKRIEEIYDELDFIEKEIVLNVRVVKSYEYSKSSVDIPLEELISSYLDAVGMDVSKRDLKNLVKFNEELQSKLGSDVFVWDVELEKIDDSQEIILVKKELDIDDDFSGEILEFLPEDFERAIFVTSVQEVGDSIYEFYSEDLEEDSLVYYFEESLKLEDLEATETLLFEEGISERSGGITGYFAFASGGFSFSLLSIILGILIMGYLVLFALGRFKIESWKRDPVVAKMITLLEKTKALLKENQVDVSRDNYYAMNELYKKLPKKCKEHFYKELAAVQLAINKKDVIGLVKEYEKAKEEFRKEDAERLYQKIGHMYKKLPEKFQEKIYRRLVKKEV